MVKIHVHVKILRHALWALIYLGLLNRGVGPKAMVPTVVTTVLIAIGSLVSICIG